MPARKTWTEDQLRTLVESYPVKGLVWCMNELKKTRGAIRQKASDLKLKQDRSSDFFKDWQSRAAKSKIGKKRPDQALVIKRLHREGKLIKTPEMREAISVRMQNQWKTKPHPKGMLGKKHSKESLAKISEASTKSNSKRTQAEWREMALKALKTRDANGTQWTQRMKASWKAGWRNIGGYEKFYRSRWEANYARYLQFLKENGKITNWKHEPKTFWFDKIKRGCVSYLPDFLVIETDGSEAYHEVKGWMDDRSKTKIKRMKKYYPEVKLVVIDSKVYKSLSKSCSGLVPGWE
jgi:hypothetical protein